MCGILGWSGPGLAPFNAEQFTRALHQLRHRGPDDQGVHLGPGVMLGHRRLSIIDLTSAGHQPMASADGRLTIVYNGEIYNFLELREQLEQLGRPIAGGSDTSVLLASLAEWGIKAFERLNGMWAFACWDESRRQLLVCRDRFGVKPLYYRHGPDGFAVASEPKALLELYPQHRTLNSQTLLRFLGHNELYTAGDSFYAGIRVLPPAHYAVYDPRNNSLIIERYWDYPEPASGPADATEAVEQFSELFQDAVRLRLRSDVNVGLTLSGGLDSTAVLGAASREARGLRCFTSVYGDGSSGELDWATRAAKRVSADITPVLAPSTSWIEILSEIAWHMDGPGYSPAVYPLWCLMQRARAENVPVLLEGQGADEALGGYPPHAVLEFLDYVSGRSLQRRSLGGAVLRLLRMSRAFTAKWTLLWLGREIAPHLLEGHRERVGFQSILRPGIVIPTAAPGPSRHGEDAVTRRLRLDHSKNVLPGLLHYGDAISMAHSIESRLPFMDYRLVEWLFRAPTQYKISRGETKWVLRRYLDAAGFPEIAARKDKKGYPTPVAQWLATGQGKDIERTLVGGHSPLHEWCDPERIKELIEGQRRGLTGSEHHLYKLLSTQVWIDRCLAQ